MMKNRTSRGSASPDSRRMTKYKTLALAFSYPTDKALKSEYDRLFRSSEIWLYGAEYAAENEFQRAQALADINGFYKAFGVKPDGDRPDSLSCELEFMHYLIFKQLHAPDKARAAVCLDAGGKFFAEHLYPAGKRVAEKIISQGAQSGFYREAAEELLEFLESERHVIARRPKADEAIPPHGDCFGHFVPSQRHSYKT